MKYIFVGDIHGKVEQVERALAKDGMKIFVGDFMDSFDRPWNDHAKCLDLVIEACKKDEAKIIYGNHELSYLQPHHRCSGYNVEMEQVVFDRKKDIEALFKSHILITPEFLVSHAGLTKQIWDKFQLTLDNLDDKLQDWWPNIRTPMHWIGNYRGGLNKVGGLFWCDWNAEFNPIEGLTQVFGHTAGRGVRQRVNSFCIDCLDNEHSFLEMEI